MTTPQSTHKRAVTILIVEDSATQCERLRSILQKAGYGVVSATDGDEGLAAAKAHAVDLVISDILMPRMDGYGLCKALRTDKKLRHLPVVLLTSLNDPLDVVRGLESGANNFIRKPYEAPALLARVQSILANEEIRRTSSSETGVNVLFAGQRFFVTADRNTILDLLLSTYESAVSQNGELTKAHDELHTLYEQLEARVAERTAEVQRNRKVLAEAEQIGHTGAWEWDIGNDRFLLSDGWGALHGVDTGVSARDEFLAPILPHDRTVVESALARMQDGTTDEWEAEYRIVLPNSGEERTLLSRGRLLRDTMGNPKKAYGIALDVTEHRAEELHHNILEARLRESQKLESIGTLAGGVAHEINNPINGIMNYAELIADGLKDKDEDLTEFALEIIRETQRVAVIVRNLLKFARHETNESRAMALPSQIVEDCLSLIRTLIRRDQITLEVDVPDDLCRISCHSQQITQVLMNLLTNARDALNEKYSGYDENKIIRVSARSSERDGGTWVRITVEDHGTGIPQAVRDRLFEPFFTTKDRAPANGTGLGLSISHGIAVDHGGQILVESEIGKWTRFHLDLPERGLQKDETSRLAESGGTACSAATEE